MFTDAFVQFLRDANSVLLVGSVILVFLGTVTPKQIFGITMEWPDRKGRNVFIVGIIMFIASLPQIRQLGVQKIDEKSLNEARSQAEQCARFGQAASTNTSDVRTCVNRGIQAQSSGNNAVTAINRVLDSIR